MLSKKELKYFSSLLYKKYRDKEGKFIVEGKKLVLEGLESNYECEVIIATPKFLESQEEIIDSETLQNKRIEKLSDREFIKLTDTKNSQGILAVFSKKKEKINYSSRLIVGLENISDPGNLGTILRNCDWFGITEVILNDDCADLYSPKVVRSTMGSLFHLNVEEDKDFYNTINRLKINDYEILCADLTGENVFQCRLDKKKFVIVFSNEANGPSNKLLSLIDRRITIPKLGQAESLNVASASAVILAELCK